MDVEWSHSSVGIKRSKGRYGSNTQRWWRCEPEKPGHNIKTSTKNGKAVRDITALTAMTIIVRVRNRNAYP